MTAASPVAPDALVIERSVDTPAIAPRGRRARVLALGETGYNGASLTRRAMQGWLPAAGSANTDTIPDLATLRARSRDLIRNTPLATGALETLVTTTIGTGIRPHPRIDRDALGLTEEEADAWERRAAQLYRVHFGTRACDLTGRNTIARLQQIALRSALESGDVFILRRYVQRPGEAFGLKLQLVEADRVSNPHFGLNTPSLMGGVELDADGVSVAYHVTDRHPGEFLTPGAIRWNRLPAFGAETGERQVLHVMRETRPGQTRGTPILAPVMEMLKQMGRYVDAELMATVIASFFTVFIKTEGSEDDSGVPSLDTLANGSPATVTVDQATGERQVNLGQGMVISLEPGESIETANPGRPNQGFEAFMQALLRQIGPALELPYEFLIKHFTASFSASQAALLEAWRSVMTRRAWLVEQFAQPCYEWLIAEAVLRGYLQAPGFFDDPLLRAAWLGVQWIGPARGQINPVQEVTAAQMRVDGGFSTIEEETAQLTGGDWERNHVQQVKEHRARERDGLDREGVAQRVITEPREPVPADPEQQDQAEQRESGGEAPAARVPRARASRRTARSVVAAETARALATPDAPDPEVEP